MSERTHAYSHSAQIQRVRIRPRVIDCVCASYCKFWAERLMCAHASGHFAQTVVAMLYSVIVGGDYGGDDDDDGSGSDD